ncbi:MAG: MFS transporter [Bacillota bacterium]
MKKQHLNVFLFLWGAIFAFICFFPAITVLPLYVYELGGTEFDTGLQMILYFLAGVLFRFYFGPLTDKKGRKIPLMISAFVFATSSLLFIICKSVWFVALVRIYHAVGLATIFSSGGALAVDLAPPNRVGVYIGIFRITFSVGLLTGPTLAMAIINSYSFQVWFVVSFFIGMLSLILLALIKEPHHRPDDLKESGPFQMFGTVLKEKAAYPALYGIALVSLVYGLLLTFVVLFVTQTTEIVNPGLYFTCFSIVAIVGNLTSGYLSDRWGRPVVVWPAIMFLGIGAGSLFFLPQTPVIFYLSSITAGLGYSGAMPSLAAWLVEVTNKDNRGTVLALQENVVDLSNGVASFVFGVLSGFLGMGLSFLFVGMTVFTLSLIKFLAFCSFRQALPHK